MLIIPIQPVPSQQVLCVLAGQNCQIAIYLRGSKVYVDLNSNGTNMSLGVIAHNLVQLDSCNSWDGFVGNLAFVDTQGVDDPQYVGFNTRWFLVYFSPGDFPVFKLQQIVSSVTILTLSEVLNVTAPHGGNFSVPHGLTVVPFLIEIIPTDSGSIWGQAGFVDSTNVNLVASDIGITAKVYVYTVAASGLTIQNPAATLLVSSPDSGDFSIPHGLGVVPSFVEILPTSPGTIWGQTPLFDATNVYLVASEVGQTATVSVYRPATGALNVQGPATTFGVTAGSQGPITIAHGLQSPPSRIGILMISSGSIWAQTPAFDATNIYLETSDSGVMARILVYA
jgi:hypothetical protein